MLLSQITVDPARFQLRDTPWSEQTVSGIVASFDPAKFDAIPVIRDDSSYIVAGDGHSRFEAVQRLAAAGELPDHWAILPDEWDIPCRVVTSDQAGKLRTANLSRDQFTACEEAKVYQKLIDEGQTVEQIALEVHKTAHHIRQTLPLNCLCADIRKMVGHATDGGGITVESAKALAAKFVQYKVNHQQQQSLWKHLAGHVSWTPEMARALADKLGPKIVECEAAGMLFELPACVPAVLKQIKDDMDALRKAARALRQLCAVHKAGILAPFVDLDRFIGIDGGRVAGLIEDTVTGHGADLVLDALKV